MTAETAPANPAHQYSARGQCPRLCAVFFFSFADALGKWFGHAGYDSFQIVFLRYTFGLIPVADRDLRERQGRTEDKAALGARACAGF